MENINNLFIFDLLNSYSVGVFYFSVDWSAKYSIP